MRLLVLLLSLFVFSCCSFFVSGFAAAQKITPRYVESSSPLPDGGRVISRSTAGAPMETIVVSPSGASNSLNNPLSVLQQRASGSSDTNSVFRQAAAAEGVAGETPRYPYPGAGGITAGSVAAQSTPRLASSGVLHPPIRASRSCTDCEVPFQVPTLALSSGSTANSGAAASLATTTAARQNFGINNCCTPQAGSATRLQVPAFQSPVLQVTPPASQVPTLAVPQGTAGFNGGLQNPFAANAGFGGGQFGGQQFGTQFGGQQFGSRSNRFLTPFVTGSGVYQPIIRLANLQPGTYLGQGIIGQPTAYVDGQPVRNLFRYIFP